MGVFRTASTTFTKTPIHCFFSHRIRRTRRIHRYAEAIVMFFLVEYGSFPHSLNHIHKKSDTLFFFAQNTQNTQNSQIRRSNSYVFSRGIWDFCAQNTQSTQNSQILRCCSFVCTENIKTQNL